jgi:STE24 endopeptidase
MIDPYILLAVLGVLVHDALEFSGAQVDGPFWPIVSGVVAPAVILITQHVVIIWGTRRLVRTGQPKWIDFIRIVQHVGSAAAVLTLMLALYVFGWLLWVRTQVGDLVVLDEALALLPTLCVLAGGWWSGASMVRMLHESVVMRRVDMGYDLHPSMSRAGIVLDRMRHRAALILVPLAFLSGWSESMTLIRQRALRGNWGGLSPEQIDQIGVALEILAVLLLVVLMPVMLRFIWRTSILSDGPLRDRLVLMCQRHKVRVRHILVWWTHGTMLNGAVIGVFGWTRMILLTDELLACLRTQEIEAVMAHEIAHIKRRHIQWMLVVVAGGIVGASMLVDITSRLMVLAKPDVAAGVVYSAQGIVAAAIFGLLVIVFGVVSRRFERQADAFSVQHSSGLGGQNPTGFGLLALPEAIAAMAGSLEQIAALNGISMHKKMYRHGSIGARIRAIRELEGTPLDHLAIDHIVRRTKRAILSGAILAGIVLGAAYVLVPLPAQQTPPGDVWVRALD